MSSKRTIVFAITILLAVGVLLGVSSVAFGYTGGVHLIATQRAVDVMQVYDRMDAIAGRDAFAPYRADAGVRFFPQLTNPSDAMSYTVVNSAYNYDEFAGDMGTRNHFWTADDDLDECPEGILGVDNAWETARAEWMRAIIYYQAGALPLAYFYLGAVMHLTEDMAQPAHTNSDLHGPTNRDSLEEWGGYDVAEPWYSWTIPDHTTPGRAFIPPSKKAIIQRVLDRTAWEGRDEFFADSALINPNDPFNTAQLFYIMYVTNQWANYFASDGESGNTRVRLGWVDYEALGFPNHLHRYGSNVSPQSESALDDNEGGCDHAGAGDEYCNYDGDLSLIAKWGYKAATKGAGAVLNLFRRTIDPNPPVTTVVTTRDDGQPFAEGAWSASPVTVKLTGATDPAPFPIFPATGVWTMYLCVNGQPAVGGLTYPITSAEKRIDQSGANVVQVRTTDNAGNTEGRDIKVAVDVTDPLILFPGRRDWYYQCESVTAKWSVIEPHSGVKYSAGMMSAKTVVRDKPIPRYLLILGRRTLSVTAKDNVGNTGFAQRTFEIRAHDGLAIGKPAVVRVGTSMIYKISGTLMPQHYEGTMPITLLISKRVDSARVMSRMVAAKVLADGRYSAFVKMTAGKWKVCAKHRYPTMVSEYTNFKVE